ncbi:major facilitator super transporter protein [Collariella sp. IMI 366227]|nr:major facilitator super transporter protein [Collariella sp. IMI 366227]
MSSRRSCDGTLSSVLLLAANLLIPAAILTFATGFFPYKPLLPGLASFDAVTEYGELPAAPFDKLVFMVVDALRSDFVYTADSGFAYLQSLIRTGDALPFTAHATSPTVTMPRLKAITTGSIPSFLDVVLNLDEADESSSLASQDTWLAQMRARGTGKLVMYGDDTWLKLFPGMFDRAEGTTSFFVSREMDNIVQQIYNAITTNDHLYSTLFVVCGDHGMNEAGNHGASSAGETSPALVFMAPALKSLKRNLQSPLPEDESFQYYSTVEQSDLAPTLSALLGLPVPKNNLGALIPEFLPLWPKKDRVQLLMRNARQILDIVTAVFGNEILSSDSQAEALSESKADYHELAHGWKRLADSYGQAAQGDNTELVPAITKWLRHAQEVLSSMASNYDTSRLFQGLAAAVVALIAAAIAAAQCVDTRGASFIPLSLIVLAYGVMMFASSYVEEEHHFWYWATTAWFAYLGLKGFKRGNLSPALQTLSTITTLLAMRLIRSWNQTGQKFAGEPDIVKLYLHTNPILLWCLIGATYFWVHQNLVYGLSGLPVWLSYALSTGLVLAAFTFKIAFTLEDAPELVTDFARQLLDLNFTQGASLVTRARTVFIGIGLLALLVVGFIIAGRRISVGQKAGSNSIASVDLSSAYNGVADIWW